MTNTTKGELPAIDAVLFDMDGVVTDTAEAHAAAWKTLFDQYLHERAVARNEDFVPFDDDRDYRQYVDGKPRYDGVQSFLQSRDINLPWGREDYGPDEHTIYGLGNRKNRYFNDWLEEHRVKVFPGTLAFIETLKRAGIGTAVFSSSRNASAVLRNASVLDCFDVKVDGADMQRLGLPGKPDPAILHQCARQLGVGGDHCAVVEDALAGVEAGLRGGYGLVIGIDHDGDGRELREKGAHLAVSDAAELMLDGRRIRVKELHRLEMAEQARTAIQQKIGDQRLVVFLDYDGTLTPIVSDPAEAVLDYGMRAAVATLADATPVAIISGRDLARLREVVQLGNVYLVGSHGFEIAQPGGAEATSEKGTAFLPDLERAEAELRPPLEKIEGAILERKQFAIAVHYRQVREPDIEQVRHLVQRVAEKEARLNLGYGKKVFRLQPAIDWNKGRAVEMLLDQLELEDGAVCPLYIGDDLTDEDAFRALAGRGINIAVLNGNRRTAADYTLAGCHAVEHFIAWLTELLQGTA